MKKGELPTKVIDDIIDNQKEVLSLHTDKYPWAVYAFDNISDGLNQANINSREVLKYVKDYVKKTGKEFPLAAQMDNPSDSLAILFEYYALAKYHDVKKIDIEKKEIRF
jgi:hypothetical protein